MVLVGMAYTTSIIQGAWLAPTAAVNIVTMPSHWIMEFNTRVYAATNDEPQVGLTWMLRHHFSFVSAEKF